MLDIVPGKTINPDTGEVTLIPPNRYLWLTHERETIYYQDGEFYAGCDSPALDWREVPSWTWDILRFNYTKEIRDSLSIVLPEDRKLTEQEKSDRREERKEILWQCDKCSESMPLNKKGVHIAHHVRMENVEKRKLKYKGDDNVASKQTADGREPGKENSHGMAKNV